MSAHILPRHPRTGQQAVGWRKARPGETGAQPIWPIFGGAEDDGDDEDDQDDDGDGKPGTGGSGKDDDAEDTTDWKAEAEKHKALSRKHEQRAKENAAAAKELARVKREGMSDVEKRVDEAVAAAVAEERVKAGVRVARSAFLAAASGRLANAKDVAEDVNLKKYVDEDGEVDEDGIAELVNRLAPKKSDTDDDEDDDRERDTRRRTRGRGFDQGARNGSGRSKSRKGPADGASLYEELIGPRASKTA